MNDTLASGTLLQARIELTIASSPGSWGRGRPIAAYPVPQPWSELSSTWNCALDSNLANSSADCSGADAWDPGGNVPSPVDPPTDEVTITNGQQGVVSFDVTADVAAGVSQWLVAKAGGGGGTVEFEARTEAATPRLVLSVDEIEVVCEPGASGPGIIDGDVIIDGDDTAGDLAQLAGVRCVTGLLSVYISPLSDLDALASVRQVGGSLVLNSNPSLSDLTGLANVVEAGSLGVYFNDSLPSLDGLEGLQTLETLYVWGNPSLVDLSSLASVTTADNVHIVDNDALPSLEGLQNIAAVSGNMALDDNDSLTDVQGCPPTMDVGANLVISGASLVDLSALGALRSVGGDLVVAHAPVLTSLAGLGGIDHVGGMLWLWELPALTSLVGFPADPRPRVCGSSTWTP